jgi:hypothetical protein
MTTPHVVGPLEVVSRKPIPQRDSQSPQSSEPSGATT